LKKQIKFTPTLLALYAMNAVLFGGLCGAYLTKWRYKGDSYNEFMGYCCGVIACIWLFSVWRWAKKMISCQTGDVSPNRAEHVEPV